MSVCAAQVQGDTYRNLEIDPIFEGETFKHVLVPVWVLTYNYGKQTFQLVANGYTGQVAGYYPKSFWKIFLLVAGILIAILLLVFLFSP